MKKEYLLLLAVTVLGYVIYKFGFEEKEKEKLTIIAGVRG